jgi:uncharacterized membrane protein YhhN
VDTYLPRLFEVSALCAVIYLVGYCYRSASWSKTVFKTVSISALALAAVLANSSIWLPLALAACAMGDYYLSREGAAEFLKGVGAFAVGHIFYILLFLTDPLSDIGRLSLNARIATLSALAIISFIMLLILWFYAGKLRLAVAGYIVIVTMMGVASATLPWQAYYNTMLLGVMFFILSDLILSLELFMFPKMSWMFKTAPFAVWMFYWLAQVLITAGLLLRGIDM